VSDPELATPMRQLIHTVFDTSSFMPHGHCYLWLKRLLLLHIISDSLIALSYFLMATALIYLARKKREIPYPWMFLMFGAFFVACGSTHLMEVVTIYIPIYWVSGAIKAITAALSVAAAVAFIPVIPKALLLQGPGELEEMNRRLQKEETKFRGLLEAAPDAMIIVNAEGKIVLLNAQAEKLFGYTREELLGNRIDILVPDSVRAHHPGLRNDYVKDPHTRPMGAGLDLNARRKDGTEFPVEISLSPMESEDGRLVTAAIRDVTERKRHAEELEKLREEAEEANRLKSEFLANMSHELRTPLNSVIGFSEIIHDSKAGPVTADQKEYLGDILGSANHLLRLINDILDLAKIEAGKIQFHPERVMLEELTQEVCSSLRTAADDKKIVMSVDIDPTLGALQSDPGRLKQVLYNYLSNALKFTPDGGKVQVRGRPEGKDYFHVSVEDTGLGILPTDLRRLFVAFQQLDASSSKKFQGTGLGLALTKKIIEAQGGHVGVDSTPGKGTIFYAVLPRKPL